MAPISAALLLILGSAGGCLAAPSAFLQLSAPPSMHGVDNFKITTTITNTGNETLRLLNDPRSPLSDLPTNLFTITNPHGTSPDFIGIEVKYIPQVAAVSRDPLAITAIAQGESVHVVHDLSLAYNFSTSGSGPYAVNVRELNTLYHVTGNSILPLLAGRGLPHHAINITGLPLPRARNVLSRGANGCEDWQERAVQSAIPLANHYVANALGELSRQGCKGGDYKRWFGAPSEHRLLTVASHFEALVGNNFTDFTFVCNTAFCSRSSGLFAYVYPDEFGKIHVCDMFFRSPVGGRDSRASTIVHESSHFTRNGGTQDHAYGPTLTQELARGYPQLAVMNADNHEYFAADAHESRGEEPSVVLAQTYFGPETYSV
ncbi:Metalloprotease [Trametes elegans]|nr:Metalloprotease [Trametes elegans]